MSPSLESSNPFENPFAPPVDLWPDHGRDDLSDMAGDDSGLDPYTNRQGRGAARPGGMGRFKSSANGMAREDYRGGGKGARYGGKGKGGHRDNKKPPAAPVEVEKKVALPAGRKVKVNELAALARLKRAEVVAKLESVLGITDLEEEDAAVRANPSMYFYI